jgi:putative heme iron utilization protein
MDPASLQTLARLIRGTRVAALGTLHEDELNLAMVAYAYAENFSAFYIHVSKLGKHTRDMETDPRASLLIVERDDQRADPQTLARVALQGTAEVLLRDAPAYELIKDLYLSRFPQAKPIFSLGDFNIWKITPKSGRFVAGFAQAFNLVPDHLKKASIQKA